MKRFEFFFWFVCLGVSIVLLGVYALFAPRTAKEIFAKSISKVSKGGENV